MNLWKTSIADLLVWSMPIVSAFLSIGAGVLVLLRREDFAAIAGIVAGLTAAIGVFVTGTASRNRDDQLRFWIAVASDAHARTRDGFGS